MKKLLLATVMFIALSLGSKIYSREDPPLGQVCAEYALTNAIAAQDQCDLSTDDTIDLVEELYWACVDSGGAAGGLVIFC